MRRLRPRDARSLHEQLQQHTSQGRYWPSILSLPAAGDEPALVLRQEYILEGTWAPGSLHGVEVPTPLQGSAASGLMH